MTEAFGIQHPIMLAGMNWISTPKLVAAVCNAGGLGTLAIAQYSPEDTRKQVRQIRELTDKPFMVNQPLHRGWAKENIQAAIEEKVPFINYSLGKPWFIDQVHAYGGKVVGTIAIAKHAARAAELGCDALIVTGNEAAAHGADATSLVLIPFVTSMVKIPVIAAGGVTDARGIAAAFVLGAAAVQIGTAYNFCPESKVQPPHRAALKSARDDGTVVTNLQSGKPARGIINRVMRELGPINDVAPEFPLAGGALAPLNAKALSQGSGDFLTMWAGQAASLGRELPARELTAKLANETQALLRKMAG
jgi:nitronate monooxygenase